MRGFKVSVHCPKNGFSYEFNNPIDISNFMNIDFYNDVKFDSSGFCNIKGLILLDLKHDDKQKYLSKKEKEFRKLMGYD